MDTLTAPGPSGVVQIILTTTPFAKLILAILLVFSVISWAIIVRKWLGFRAVQRSNRAFLARFRQRTGLAQFSASGIPGRGASPLPQLLNTGLGEWRRLVDPRTGLAPEATESALQVVAQALDREVSREVEHYEKQLSFLATAGSASPFLGLLGTVWGIMKSFMDIRGMPSVNVQTVAPGIADALVVTAAGLLVAVPAVIFYNHFLGRIKDLTAAMERFSSEVTSDLRRETLKAGTATAARRPAPADVVSDPLPASRGPAGRGARPHDVSPSAR